MHPLPPQDPPVDAAWPYDGPHDGDTTLQAGQALAELVRYLVTATGPDNRAAALPYAPQLSELLGTLSQAANRLDQLLVHTASAAQTYAADPTIADDRTDRAGAQTATELSEALRAAGSLAGELAAVVDDAHRRAAHLRHDQ